MRVQMSPILKPISKQIHAIIQRLDQLKGTRVLAIKRQDIRLLINWKMQLDFNRFQIKTK